MATLSHRPVTAYNPFRYWRDHPESWLIKRGERAEWEAIIGGTRSYSRAEGGGASSRPGTNRGTGRDEGWREPRSQHIADTICLSAGSARITQPLKKERQFFRKELPTVQAARAAILAETSRTVVGWLMTDCNSAPTQSVCRTRHSLPVLRPQALLHRQDNEQHDTSPGPRPSREERNRPMPHSQVPYPAWTHNSLISRHSAAHPPAILLFHHSSETPRSLLASSNKRSH